PPGGGAVHRTASFWLGGAVRARSIGGAPRWLARRIRLRARETLSALPPFGLLERALAPPPPPATWAQARIAASRALARARRASVRSAGERLRTSGTCAGCPARSHG